MHFAAELFSGVQARYTVKFDSDYESKLSTPYQIRLYMEECSAFFEELQAVLLYLENRILNQNLKYQSLQKRDIQDIRGVYRKIHNKTKQKSFVERRRQEPK